jgi:hypothetical protein
MSAAPEKTLKAISIPLGSSVGAFDGGSGLIRIYHGGQGWIDFFFRDTEQPQWERNEKISTDFQPRNYFLPIREIGDAVLILFSSFADALEWWQQMHCGLDSRNDMWHHEIPTRLHKIFCCEAKPLFTWEKLPTGWTKMTTQGRLLVIADCLYHLYGHSPPCRSHVGFAGI